MKHTPKGLGNLILYVVKENHLKYFDTDFSSPIFVQARLPEMQSNVAILEQVIFMGVTKKDGMVPLMTPDLPICRSYDLDDNEDIENVLTEDEICGLCMRDDELSLVVAIGKETCSNGDVAYTINGWSDRATPREMFNEDGELFIKDHVSIEMEA